MKVGYRQRMKECTVEREENIQREPSIVCLDERDSQRVCERAGIRKVGRVEHRTCN